MKPVSSDTHEERNDCDRSECIGAAVALIGLIRVGRFVIRHDGHLLG